MELKKIVLISSGQPSVNPRLVKEADALNLAGHDVTVLYCFWIEWASASDTNLFKNAKWNHRLIGCSPSDNRWIYLFTKARQKANRFFNKILGNKFLFAERTQARCYDELLKAAKCIKADWYIGHNLGALPVTVKAAVFHNAKCGFDFEDYHREENNNMATYEKKRITSLEEKYISALNYCSAASPMITERVKRNLKSFNKPVITLLNCFPLSLQPGFRKKKTEDKTLQLFWFSQTVGKNRGLEILIKVLNNLNDPSIYLTLAGNGNDDFKDYLKENAGNIKNNIILAGIIEPYSLPEYASKFDVGLAIELVNPENRNICLTNKIFTYLLAGNAIILSKTLMQERFNKEYHIGQQFTITDEDELESKIMFYKDYNNLESQRLHNYQLARNKLNWENESKKLMEIIT